MLVYFLLVFHFSYFIYCIFVSSNVYSHYDRKKSSKICQTLIWLSDFIKGPLALIINDSFKAAIFPAKLKVSMIHPIHKGESKIQCSNYQPISILTIFSKIVENKLCATINRISRKIWYLIQAPIWILKGKINWTRYLRHVLKHSSSYWL